MNKLIMPTILRNSLDKSIKLTCGTPRVSLIWLHGLGDQPQSFVPYFSHPLSVLYQGARITLIKAPQRYVTLNSAPCNSWYDVKSLERFTQPEQSTFNLNELKDSSKIIQSYVQQETDFWQSNQNGSNISPYHRIFIGGMSQGGVVSLHHGLQSKYAYAGIITAGSYFLKTTEMNNKNKVPILLMHGARDPVIRQKEAVNSYKRLLEDNNIAQYVSEPKLDHTVSLKQLQKIKDWISETYTFIERHYQRQN